MFIALSMLLSAGGCAETEGDRGFKDGRPDFMREMRAALMKSGIPFEIDQDGFIRYPGKHEEAVKRIQRQVAEEISGGVIVRYADKESREYLKSLLSSRSMKFTVEVHEDGELIRWYPQSKEQMEEIEMRVVRHNFDLQQERSPSPCMQGAAIPEKSPAKDSTIAANREC